MVAIVSGNSLGLSSTSLATLGQRGLFGAAGQGSNGELAFVNVATGNLVLQDRDDMLVTQGPDFTALRTYNSQGLADDDNDDNWSTGFFASNLLFTGTLNTAGSTVTRSDRDGARALYTFDAATQTYNSTAGAGAYDTIRYDAGTDQFTWTDGDSGITERYGRADGHLLSTTDPSGNTTNYQYTNGFMSKVVAPGGDSVVYDYTVDGKLNFVRMIAADGTQTTRVSYTYDKAGRLASVTVDLTPQITTDAVSYTTTYGYAANSNRLASVTQSDGTSYQFTYVQSRLASVTDGLGQTTTFTYDATNRRTTVTDPLNRVTVYDYDAAGQLTKVTAPAVAGVSQATSFAYNASGDLLQVTDAAGGVVTMNYDAKGNQTLQRDAAGNTVARTFDANNQLLTEAVYATADPDGAGPAQPADPLVTRYIYDTADDRLLRFVVSDQGRVTEHRYDALGQRTATLTYTGAKYDTSGLASTSAPSLAQMTGWVVGKPPLGLQRTDMAYDFRGQLQTRTVWAAVGSAGNGVTDGKQSVTTSVYDYNGQLLQTVSPAGGVTVFKYDGLGRVTTTTDALGQVTVATYDNLGRKIGERDGNGKTATWTFDYFGKVTAHTDIGGAHYAYAYDALGRLRWVADGRAYVNIDYDAVGNRERIQTHVINGDATQDSDRYFQYDAMNRQTVADAADALGNLGVNGHRITYDLAGQKKTDTWQGNVVSVVPGTTYTEETFTGGSTFVPYTDPDSYVAKLGPTTETYDYDALGRLIKIDRDGTTVDERNYDAGGRTIKSGEAGLNADYLKALNGTNDAGQVLGGNGSEVRFSAYDGNGRLASERVLNAAGEQKYQLFYTVDGTNTPRYDAAGNSLGYSIDDGHNFDRFTYAYTPMNGYRQTSVHGERNPLAGGGPGPIGDTTSGYDANGFLTSVSDSTQAANNRTFVNDVAGNVLYVRQGAHAQPQLIVNGEVLGRYGETVDDKAARGSDGAPVFTTTADFSFGFKPTGGDIKDAAPTSRVVGAGDTLQSIAQSSYGDSRLWYVIAEANGLTSNQELKAGQVLKIPATESTANAADTFKPYDPSKVVGDTSPFLPAPPHGSGGCGGIGQIIIIAVAVAASFYLGPEMLELVAPGVAPAEATFGQLAMAGAMTGAASSAVSQVVGIASGLQDGLNWKGVALGAIGGGLSAGLGGINGVGGVDFTGSGVASSIGNRIIQAGLANALTQGVAVVTGLQQKFDWRGVAASAAGAAVGSLTNEALGITDANGKQMSAFQNSLLGERVFKSTLSGLAAGTTAAMMRGGRISVTQVATDAFGNALGSSIAEDAGQGPSASVQQDDPLGEFIEKNMPSWEQRQANFDQIVNVFGQAGGDRGQGVALAAVGYTGGLGDSASSLTAAQREAMRRGYGPRTAGSAVNLLERDAAKFEDSFFNESSPSPSPASEGAAAVAYDPMSGLPIGGGGWINGGGPDGIVARALKWSVTPIEPLNKFKEEGVAPLLTNAEEMMALAQSPKTGFFARMGAYLTAGDMAYRAGTAEAGFPDTPLAIASTIAGAPGAAAELRVLNAMARREVVMEAASELGSSGRALGTVEELQFWNEAKVFGNDKLGYRRVYQRDDLFDPYAVVDDLSNLDRMAKGRAPIGYDGQPINMHHLTQNEPGALAEVSSRFHSDNTDVLHGMTEAGSSFRYSVDGALTEAEKAFNRFKYWYWQQRGKGF